MWPAPLRELHPLILAKSGSSGFHMPYLVYGATEACGGRAGGAHQLAACTVRADKVPRQRALTNSSPLELWRVLNVATRRC